MCISKQELIQRIRALQPGTVIPKPEASGDFVVKGIGRRSEQDALVYLIPNHEAASKPYQKGVTIREWESAYDRLATTGELTRRWFDANLTRCASEGSCKFTTVGGIFSLLGIAFHDRPGIYRAL